MKKIEKRVFDDGFVLRHLSTGTGVFLDLLDDREGQEKYKGFLEGLRNKFEQIKKVLRTAGEKGEIDEESFASYYADAERNLKLIEIGGWSGFCQKGSQCFGAAVNCELVLRGMEHSLGSLLAA